MYSYFFEVSWRVWDPCLVVARCGRRRRRQSRPTVCDCLEGKLVQSIGGVVSTNYNYLPQSGIEPITLCAEIQCFCTFRHPVTLIYHNVFPSGGSVNDMSTKLRLQVHFNHITSNPLGLYFVCMFVNFCVLNCIVCQL